MHIEVIVLYHAYKKLYASNYVYITLYCICIFNKLIINVDRNTEN